MIFKRGMDANNHPGFYRQIGQEPQQLITAALDICRAKWREGDHLSSADRPACGVCFTPESGRC